jgi:hypothetical protein
LATPLHTDVGDLPPDGSSYAAEAVRQQIPPETYDFMVAKADIMRRTRMYGCRDQDEGNSSNGYVDMG